jgi:uncharacterized membrane protein (DUF4010 family)
MTENTWLLIFISIALGLLVGLQRESASSKTAGIRTFPLITLSGTICGLLVDHAGGWVLAAGFIGVASILIMANIMRMKSGDVSGGMTTETAVLLMFAMGAYLVFGSLAVGVVVTGVVTVLLHFKTTLHGWVDRIGQKDLLGVMKFVLISMVILPVLPDQTYDKYDSLNPRDTWLMVVLIVGISLSGYFLYKVIGKKAGVMLGGILGGLISSTATTISYAKTAGKTANTARIAAFVILVASAVSLIRVLVEISIVAPGSFMDFVFPIGAELVLMVMLILVLFFRHRKDNTEMPEQSNPAQLKGAIIFALLYAAISFVSAMVRENFGHQALYFVSVLSGLTDLDAITLSTAKMTEQKSIEASLGWRLVLVAAMANLVFKGGLAMVIGGRYLGKAVFFLFGILLLAGFAILFLWPS